jgi:hypothetical protein
MDNSVNTKRGLLYAALIIGVWSGSAPAFAQYSALGAYERHPDHPTEGLDLDVNRFRPDPRDLYHEMDQVADENGQLHPLQFDMANESDRHAAYGRNTWMMWCAGNEGFWDWLAQEGYGFLDLLHVVDSRGRDHRFRDYGLVNQPGMKSRTSPGPFGLYLDTVEKQLSGPPGAYAERDAGNQSNEQRYSGGQPYDFRWQTAEYPDSDGVDPFVYGYPSGVIGLRLFPNPNFDEAARARWNAEAFYSDPEYARDPKNVRPFRVGMSCAFCHVAPHPLNPPADPENPEWSNLSAIIGNQYFRTSEIFGSRARRGNFIWHLLSLAQPGTIDASLISTDHINNPNTMNAVFEVPARLARAAVNPAEGQGGPARSLPAGDAGDDARRTPRVLLDGADSVGTWGALARVYLNIGTFYEEWNLCHNPVLGFTKQKPFEIDVCRRNSIYWRANEAFRVDDLVSFFTWHHPTLRWQKSTAPMKLSVAAARIHDEPQRQKIQEQLDSEKPRLERGKQVFVDHCMVCHSSKQPDGFAIDFQRTNSAVDWSNKPAAAPLTMPFEWENWEAFKKSPAYQQYLKQAAEVAGSDDFLDENFFSTDLRIPVSLVGTNAGRPLGTNALDGEVWSDFSSETYKHLPAVGRITYSNPFSGKVESFQPPGEGRGYCRPATLVGLWATAPFLHNNALGKYLQDSRAAQRVSVEGRLEMFDDAIEKLLWSSRRAQSPSGEGGLRLSGDQTWLGRDPGWIFRTDQETWIELPAKHLRFGLERTLPGWVVWLVDYPWLFPLILALIIAFALKARRHGVIFATSIVLGVVLLTVLVATGIHHILPVSPWPLVFLLLLGGLLSLVGPKAETARPPAGPDRREPASLKDRVYAILISTGPIIRQTAIFALAVTAVVLWGAGSAVKWKVDGRLGDLSIGPIPQGTPVNALMNLDAEAPISAQLGAVRGLLNAIGKINNLDRTSADYAVASRGVFDKYAGPGLMAASKCPDLTMDRGHLFGESLSDDDKYALIAFLRTL